MIRTPDVTDAADGWLARLKAAVDAGFYKTEEAEGEQTPFPWQGKYCQDCPFWSRNVCRVYMDCRSGLSHTCRFFDQANELAARALIRNAGRLDEQHHAA